MIVNIRRYLQTDLGKIANDLLSSKRIVSSKGMPEFNAVSITDMWIKNSLSERTHRSNRLVALSIPVILKALQNLRRNENHFLYFTLLNRIQSSKIHWISQNNKEIEASETGQMPIEFYNELANMLYRMSLSMSPGDDLFILAKFTLRLLENYTKITRMRLKIDTLYKCSVVVTKTQSISYFDRLIEIIEEAHANNTHVSNTMRKILADISYIAFFTETDQVHKLESELTGGLFRYGKHMVDLELMDLFYPTFIRTAKYLLLSNSELCARKLIELLDAKWNVRLQDHDLSELVCICEKNAFDDTLTTLQKLYPNDVVVRSYNWSVKDIANKNFEEYVFDLKNKVMTSNYPLSDIRNASIMNLKLTQSLPNLEEMFQSLENIGKKLNNTPGEQQLKVMILNSMFLYLAQNSKYGKSLLFLEYLVQSPVYNLSLVDASNVNTISYPGLHTLFRAVSLSTSTTFSKFILFKQLKNSPQLKFQFTVRDYCLLLQNNSMKEMPSLLYYYLYHFLQAFGNDFYTSPNIWILPKDISSILEGHKCVPLFQLLAGVRKMYCTTPQSCTSNKLTRLFATRFPLDEKQFENTLLQDLNELYAGMALPNGYSLDIDIHNAERTRDALERLEAALSQLPIEE
ncbi:Mne1p KNAG_0E00370 [Huiozyma naganishii CBS 8797]|uniref:Uncharacterized protein n=1 Tax=Huiozyma naganishii (strain ATCC MYA-139 / BCRC 22969 / CBS 8797 / KCTC 17520 / NBRC 10181 / NCYC 3082 / Yp74L-3) TaxID=1071383 RepID=J7R619_HUIN7|nr:hypothetical protein KNAG_0E00370 [Kazachstania naganishii CBS 8797]CCK70305.1 hypothetical protein KNAG_0E00370 [Kazachstania naganishii CBS 8797]